MTSAILPDLLACPAPVLAVPETAPAAQAVDAGDLAAEFSSLLLALLPSGAVPAQNPGTAAEQADDSVSGRKTPTGERKIQDQDTEEEQPSELDAQPEVAPVATVPVAAAPAPALFTLASALTADSTGIEAPEGAENLSKVSRQAETAQTEIADSETVAAAASPAIPIPAGFVAENSAPAPAAAPKSTAPAEASAETPRPVAASSGRASEVPQSGQRATAPEAELAFTARLVAEPAANAASGQRAPERHLAMPHELRAPATEAQPSSARVETTLSGSTVPSMDPGTKTAQGSATPAEVPAGTPVAVRQESPAAIGETNRVVAAAGLEAERAGTDAGSTQEDTASGERRESGSDRPSASRLTAAGGGSQQEDAGQRQSSPAGDGSRAIPLAAQSSEARVPAAGAAAAAPRVDRAQEIAAALDGMAPASPASSGVKGSPVRELSVVVPGRTTAGGETAPQVEVRVVERTGEVQVSVRSSDERMNTTLREDLGQLVSQLGERGYRAETWHPGAAASAAGSGDASPAPRAASESGREGGDGSQSGRGGSDTAGREGDARRDQKQNQPEWLEAFERSLGRAQAPFRSETL